jgi:hypothetical protein
MEVVLTRKIKVVGCLNCPYLFKQELTDMKYAWKCHHPSFQGSPMIPFKNVEGLGSNMDSPMEFPNSSFPDWCPLEVDMYVCSCNPLGTK